MASTKLGRFIRRGLMVLLGALLVIQFFRPAPNNSMDDTKLITKSFETSGPVLEILKTSCFDCHSNNTVYPWYSKVQPMAWWLDDHVKEGKREINFSEFSGYSPRRQFKKFKEIVEQVETDEMPLSSYTLVHQNAKLSDSQKLALMDWAKACQEKMKLEYPIDSLQKKKG